MSIQWSEDMDEGDGGTVKCGDCGEIPWLITHDGDAIVRCKCEAVAIAAVDSPHCPGSWG